MGRAVWRTDRRARPVLAAVVVVGLQALALVVVVVLGVAALVTGGTSASSLVPGTGSGTGDTSWGLTIAALVGAGVLAALGWAVATARGWARGPLVTVEVLAVLVGISTLSGGEPAEGLALGLPALVVVVLLFLPGVAAATTSEHRRRGAYADTDTDAQDDDER